MNEPISHPQQTNTPPATEVPTPQKLITSKPIASWLLVGLIVLLLGTTSVFAYKYYELKQQTDNQQPASSVPPAKVTTTSPSPAPILSPANDPTESWRIYEYMGFEFKYPEEWKAEEQKFESGGPPQVWVYSKEGQKAGAIPSYCLRFTQIQNSQANTPEEAWLLEKQNEEAWLIKYQYKEILKEGKMIVNNLPGFQIVGKSLAPKPDWEKPILIGREIILLNRGMEVKVTYGEWVTEDEFEQGNYWPKYGETIDQILSTLKFTN